MKEEKYINEKLSNYDSPLDMDMIWGQLETALDKKDKKPKFFAFKKLIGLLSLVLIISSLIWCYSNYQSDKAQSTISSLNQPVESKTIERPVSQLSDAIGSNTVISNDESEALTNKKVVKTTSPIKNSQTSINVTTSKKSASESALLTKIKNSVPTNITSPLNSNNESTNKITTTTPSQHYNNSNFLLAQTNQSQISNTPKLEEIQLSLLDYNRTQPKPNKLIKPHTPSPSPWSFDIYSGQSFSYAKYSGTISDGIQIDNFETLLESWTNKTEEAQSTTNNLSYGLAVKRKVAKNWYIESGINFLNHGTTFSYSDTTYNSNLTESDSTIFRRDIKAYNKINTLQIPLLIGKEFNKNKLSFNMAVGVGINFLRNEEGYQFNLFNASQEPIFTRRSSGFESELGISAVLSGLAQMDIGYSFSEHLGLFSGIQAGRTKDLNSNSGDELGISSSFNYWGIRAGLRYSL